MEQLKQIMQQMMASGFAPKFDGTADPIRLRNMMESAQANMPLEPGVRYEKCDLGGIEAELSIPENAHDDAIVLYIHGGGLVCGTAKTSRGYAGTLAGESRLPVYSISYRLAPENRFPAAVDDCFAAWRGVLRIHPGKPIFLIGESAGAYLSIVTALRARDEKAPLPAGIALYSPCIDWTGAIERDFPGNRDFTIRPDSLVTIRNWYAAPDEDFANPYLSPYYADYFGMPPMFLSWDESESLAKDSESLRDKAVRAGVEVVWKSYPDCFHAFATTGRGTPESYEVLRNTIAFFHNHISPVSDTQEN